MSIVIVKAAAGCKGVQVLSRAVGDGDALEGFAMGKGSIVVIGGMRSTYFW